MQTFCLIIYFIEFEIVISKISKIINYIFIKFVKSNDIKLLLLFNQYKIASNVRSMDVNVYKLSLSHEYKAPSYVKVLGSSFIKCQSSFIYVVKYGTIGLRIFSNQKRKAYVELFGPVTMSLSFKSFCIKTFYDGVIL